MKIDEQDDKLGTQSRLTAMLRNIPYYARIGRDDPMCSIKLFQATILPRMNYLLNEGSS